MLRILRGESLSHRFAREDVVRARRLALTWIGHFDLTTSLGILAATVEDARAWLERGFRCVGYGLDAWLYEDALRSGLAALRGPA